MPLCNTAPRSSTSDWGISVGADGTNSTMLYSRERDRARRVESREHSRNCWRDLEVRSDRRVSERDANRERGMLFHDDVHAYGRSCSRSPRSRRRHRRDGRSWSRRKSDMSSARSRSSSRSRSWRPPSDEEGHLIYRTGDRLGRCEFAPLVVAKLAFALTVQSSLYDHQPSSPLYEILSTLGQGTFGKVTSCRNLDNGRRIALKIIKSVEKYRHAAKIEIRVLKHLRDYSDEWHHCVCMIDSFNYYGHICIAFQELGLSLFEFMRLNNFRSYPFDQVQLIACQVASALKYMHSLKLTHTDLKPENILLINSDSFRHYDPRESCYVRSLRNASVCVIDFGSATYESEHHSTIVSTRHYRAPEVILEIGWSYPCDVWSLGCIIFELHTAVTLFQTHSNLEHLAMMEAYLGKIPSSMLTRSQKAKYVNGGRLRWDETSSAAAYIRHHCNPLFHYANSSLSTVVDMFDFIRRALTYEPSCRLTASEALQHRFLNPLKR